MFEQIPEDAVLLDKPGVQQVLGDDGDAIFARSSIALLAVAVGQHAQQGVVLVGGEVVP